MNIRVQPLQSPFPWFGGKSRVASIVWRYFGNVPNYIEPFFGSGAVLLGRPHAPQVETINDKDCYVANFWRAVKNDPNSVAKYADWPVNEADQHARHRWLVKQDAFRDRMMSDPDYYDAKIAGWWVWGQSIWIGSGWCSLVQEPAAKRRSLGSAGRGLSGLGGEPSLQVPHLSSPGQGIKRSRPHLSSPGQGIKDYMQALMLRLKNTRVCCGDWSRICGPSPTVNLGITGVLLDPPYSEKANRKSDLYSVDDEDVAHAVAAWAIEQGEDKRMRIALCGYEGEHQMPASWKAMHWKAAGGYGCQGEKQGRENCKREMIWFSPHCIKATLV